MSIDAPLPRAAQIPNRPLFGPRAGGFRSVRELPRPVALDLVGLLEGRAVDPLDQRLRDRPDGLELDRVRAHLVAGAALAVGRIHLLRGLADGLRQRSLERGPARRALALAAVDAVQRAADPPA